MKIISNTGFIVIIFIFIVSCAKISSPSGGPMDEDPPVILKSVPENRSVNFSSKSFEITFDEYFVLENINQVLMISPPLKDKPEIKIKGKTFQVVLEEELLEDITYTFNFLDAIQDLNEKNQINNYQYVFSTGAVLDSLSITGEIFDAYNLEAGEDILVLLYSALADSVPNTIIPRYIARADEEGRFRIDNIANGEYRIYGLKDNNNNKYYDLPDETFAFIDSSITITALNNYIPPRPDSLFHRNDSVNTDTLQIDRLTVISDSLAYLADSLRYEHIPGKEIKLYYFVGENKIQYLTGTDRSSPYLLSFTFAMPVEPSSFQIEFPDIDAEGKYFTELSSGQDTFRIWITDSVFYSMEKIVSYLDSPETDTTGVIGSVRDTINLRYIKEARGRKAAKGKEALQTKTNMQRNFIPGQLPVFSFARPMLDPDTSMIFLYLLSDTIRLPHEYTIIRDTLDAKKFMINASLLQDSSYVLLTDKSAFSDIYGYVSDSVEYAFTVRNSSTLGKVILNISSNFKGNFIVQLIDGNENVKQEKSIILPEDSRLIFENLEKGDYYVKTIFDIDGNGKWTSGDYSLKQHAEPVSYYPKKLTVKPGWDLEEDWKITGMRDKSKVLRKTGAKKRR